MKNYLAMAILAGAMGLMTGGCTDPIPAYQDQLQPSQVTIADFWLQQQVRVSFPSQPQRVGAGQLRVAMLVRNLTDDDKSLDYMYTFVDDHGTAVGNPSGWEAVKLPPRGVQEVSFTSMSADARNFRVEFRKAQ